MKTKKAVKGIAPGMVGAIVVGLAIWPGHQAVHAMQSTTPALTGWVTSVPEGRMEGALVSARREGSNITVTVVSDAAGVYSFPRDRLEPGEYTIGVRAAGYVLRPSTRVVEVTGEAPSVKDLHLGEATLLEKALQLSSAEWLWSYPLLEETTFVALRDCARCHNQQRVAMSRFNEEQLRYVMQRMSYYWLGSTAVTYQIAQTQAVDWGRGDGVMARPPTPLHDLQSKAVSAINLSNGPWQYPLKTYPRPTGENTNVIYTTYDLPRVVAKPHDVQMGPDGWIYYDDFNDNVIGKLNPKTGETVEYRFPDLVDIFPELAAEGSMIPVGNRVLMPDGQGKFYLAPPGLRRGIGYTAVFDTESETFEFYPGTGHFTAANSKHVDGNVWFRTGGQLYQAQFLDDGKWEGTPVGNLSAYDHYVDSKNNVYGASRGSTEFWRVDAKTHEITYYPIPEEPRGETGLGGGSRRGYFDAQDRLWFGGFDGNYVGKLDPSMPAGQAIELFPVPMPWFQPYMAVNDDAGYVWTGSISADHVARMNEETGEWNFYLLPAEANIRHMHVQRSESGGLSSSWIGANHEGRIVHIEPLAP